MLHMIQSYQLHFKNSLEADIEKKETTNNY